MIPGLVDNRRNVRPNSHNRPQQTHKKVGMLFTAYYHRIEIYNYNTFGLCAVDCYSATGTDTSQLTEFGLCAVDCYSATGTDMSQLTEFGFTSLGRQ